MAEQLPTETVSDARLAELAGAYWPDGAAVFGSEIRACLQELQRLRSSGGAKTKLECTGCGDPPGTDHFQPICSKFEQQDDGEGRVSAYCAACGHSSDCHEPVSISPEPSDSPLVASDAFIAAFKREPTSPADSAWMNGYAAGRRSPEPSAARTIVNAQAEDEGLWFRPQTVGEDMLQKALRRLHAAVESPSGEPSEIPDLPKQSKNGGW